MKGRLPVLLVSLLFLAVPLSADGSDADSGDREVLVDFGNGRTAWLQVPEAEHPDLVSAASAALEAAGMAFILSADGQRIMQVDGTAERSVGHLTCSWRFYYWNSYMWDYGETSGAAEYSGEPIAIGFYPSADMKPVPTPLDRSSWTSFRGDSSGSCVSGSCGPGRAVTPLEWHMGYSTGGVYSSLLYADGLIYHTTGGDINGSGMARQPCVYCVDTVNHEIAWNRSYMNKVGYEVSSPLIAGDLLIVTSSNGHVYALDRFDGSGVAELLPKGEQPHFASIFDTSEYIMSPTYDSDGNRLIEGKEFDTGPATAVYDSGALYFNTSDGQMRCYSVSRDDGFREIWTYLPDDPDRGCFYYHPPVLADAGGRHVVLSGSYSGRLYCVDASTGEGIWTVKIANFSEDDPGTVSSITLCGTDRALVCCDDGELGSSRGTTLYLDLTDGTVLRQLDIMCSPPVYVDGTVYTYVKPGSEDAVVLDKLGNEVPAPRGYYAFRADTGRTVWTNTEGVYTKSGMTFCDGRLYCADYAPGTFWPQGGAVRCLDPETGLPIWTVQLKPFSGTGYNMSVPTVADGKVYAANDSGILYCISEVPGVDFEVTESIEYQGGGFLHWTWLALFGTTAVLTVLAAVLYRRG